MSKALEYLKKLLARVKYVEGFSYKKGEFEEAIAEVEQMEARIKELEVPKTCDSCKHIRKEQFRDYEVATCTNYNCNEMYDSDVGNDFCCNKFEPKDNQ